MKVVCISRFVKSTGKEFQLTIGEVYEAELIDMVMYQSVYKIPSGYVPTELFVSIKEWREIQLNKIL